MDTSSASARPRPKTILLLSGTAEGPLLARLLCEAGFHVHATVTRPQACADLFCLPSPPGRGAGGEGAAFQVESRGFTAATLADFLRGGVVDLVLDATHPFAVRITRIAHGVCTELGFPYVRYERPDWTPPPGTLFADGYAEAAERLPALGSRAMLTIGAKQLKHFAGLQQRMTLFARILPARESLEQAFAAGFSAHNVLCMRPPFSREFNRAIFREYRADVLVTKASGREGGVAEKVAAANDLGMNVLLIRRPVLPEIDAVVDNPSAAIAECRRRLGI